MTLWELTACLDGYNEAHTADDENEMPPFMSSAEYDDMMVRHLRIIRGGKATNGSAPRDSSHREP